jgi:hypothetical protein
MTATHAVKAGKRYRYYVSRRLVTGTRDSQPTGQRIPAGDIERLVVDRLRQVLAGRSALFTALREANALPAAAEAQQRLLQQAEQLAQRWGDVDRAEMQQTLAMLVRRIVVHHDRVEIDLAPPALLALLLGGQPGGAAGAPSGQDAAPLVLTIPVRLQRSGKEMALLVEGPEDARAAPDPVLIKLLAKAHALRDALAASDAPSLTLFAERQRLSKSYVTRVVRLAYLAPAIVTAILDGHQPAGFNAKRLLQDSRVPLAWADQQSWFDAF